MAIAVPWGPSMAINGPSMGIDEVFLTLIPSMGHRWTIDDPSMEIEIFHHKNSFDLAMFKIFTKLWPFKFFSDTLLATPTQPMIIFYADDLAIGTQGLSSLQKNLNTLHKYCKINRLFVNVKKTKIMRFCKGGGLRKKPIIYYGKEPIEFVNEFVYLGIKFQTNLKPTKHLIV